MTTRNGHTHPLALLALLALAGAPACDSDAKDTKAKKQVAHGKAPGKAGPTKLGVHGKPNPHAGLGNPHGPGAGKGMPPNPHAGPPKDPYPNPREVTPGTETRVEEISGLTLTVPSEWTRVANVPPGMRLAELTLPGPGGDVKMAIYRFPGGAGGIDANIKRWRGQFQDAAGKPIAEDPASVTTSERAPLTITSVDFSGTYVAAVRPGSPQRLNVPEARMFAAIVAGVGDPFFLKAVGPKKTVDLWEPGFKKVVETVTVKAPPGGDAKAPPAPAGADAKKAPPAAPPH